MICMAISQHTKSQTEMHTLLWSVVQDSDLKQVSDAGRQSNLDAGATHQPLGRHPESWTNGCPRTMELYRAYVCQVILLSIYLSKYSLLM